MCTRNNLTADQRLTAEPLNEGRETRRAVLFCQKTDLPLTEKILITENKTSHC